MAVQRPSPLDRALRLISPVQPGESLTALLLTLNIFLVLLAYYLVKVVREPLIISGGGAEVKTYAAVAQTIALIFVVKGYEVLSARVSRVKLIVGVTTFFIANLGLFFVMAAAKVAYVGVIFFVWVGIFSNTMTAQFWGFANDVYSKEQGERLFPLVGLGMSVGAVAGALIARLLIGPIGVINLMLVSALVLAACVVLTIWVDRRESQRSAARADEVPGEEAGALQKGDAFLLVLKDRYLLMIAAMIFVLNWVNTNGEYILDKAIQSAAKEAYAAAASTVPYEAYLQQFVGVFRSEMFFWVNLAGVLTQALLVSRIIKYLSPRWALLILPAISMTGNSLFLMAPLLAMLRIAKIAENSTDYSLQNTLRHTLFLVTSREAKYKAKQVIDNFVVRAGDLFTALFVFLGTKLALTVTHYALANVLLAAAWIALALAVGRAYSQQAEAS